MKASIWISSAALGLLAAATVLTETWLYLLIALPGIMLVAFTLLYPRWGLLLWLLLAPVANTYAAVSLPVGIPDITFGRVLIVVVIVALVLQARLKGRPLARWGGVELATLAVLSIAAIDQFLRSGSPMSDTLRHFDARVLPFLLFLAARNLCVGRNDLKNVGYILAGLGCYLALHGTYQYFTYSPGGLAGLDAEQIDQLGHLVSGRAVGPFVNSVEYGGVVAIAFASTLVLALHASSGIFRMVLLAALAPLGVGIIVSSTRAVWLGWYLSLLTMAVLDRRARPALLVSIGAMTLIAGALTLTLSETSLLKQRTMDTGAIDSRTMMYRIGVRMAVKAPLFGYGSGAPSRVAARSESYAMGGLDADFAAGQFHNVYIMTLIEWGIGGLMASLAIHILLVRTALKLRRLSDKSSLAHHFAGLFLTTTVIYMVQGLFADTPPFLYLTGVYFFLGGLIHAQLDATLSSRGTQTATTDATVPAWSASVAGPYRM